MVVEEKDLKLILKALEFSARKHKNQRRRDIEASPYINHPISLANILCNEAHVTDVNVICGALLHDTIEDTETIAEELEAEFGVEIKDIVMDVTDDTSLHRHERKQAQIDHAPHICNQAQLIILADKISKLRDMSLNPPPSWSLDRRQEYFDWAKKVIDQLRGANAILESIFDDAYAQRPSKE
ncbi:MAG: HD domain-containing protein [Gammaproteobacteria bacterium]|nr:HD domain-containing protein [Gammaproteobacteria bacterium]NNJ51023.1 HD domain-containing protein [Gammaproteobacteria bacterium]